MKPITTITHGVLDYVSVVTMLAAPRLFGWSKPIRTLLSVAALSTLGYSVLTRYELGLVKLLPMRGHLALDASSGAFFCAAPLILKGTERSAQIALVGMGLFEIAAASLTQPESSDVRESANNFMQ